MPLSLRHLLCLAPPQFPRQDPNPSRHEPLFLTCSPKDSRHFPALRTREFLPKAASISGSGAEIPEQLVGGAEKRRRRSVAGVDQDELLDPEKLADPDSFFCEFRGVRIHHKICHQEDEEEVKDESFPVRSGGIARIGLPMILLHGFGASVYSWDRVMKPLARLTGSKVLAFDRPAFGLTSRVSHFGLPDSRGGDATPLNPYSMAFSVLATLSFIDILGSRKAILMGHSAGCLVAVNTYFEAPERVAALILVAPAIVAPFVSRKLEKENRVGKGNQSKDGNLNSGARENSFVRVWKGLIELFKRFARTALGMLKGMRDMVSSIYMNALSAVLRSSFAVMLVRMVIDKFGIPAVRNAWYDASQATDHVLQGYTKPLRAKGWEKALLEFTLAMLTDSTSKSEPPLARRLAEISCPVLIVTGDTDRLVPSWNAERLSQAVPGSTLEVIKNCGHLPHEERVDEFLSAVERFLQRVFGAPEVRFSEAAAAA